MKTAVLSMLLGGFFLFSHISPVQGKGLITAKELAAMATDENVRIVSVRKANAYAKVHIKGAVNVDLHELYQAGEIKGLLRPAAEIAAVLGAKGISRDNTIVIYDGGSGSAAGRLYWILEYLGASDVRLLDGQMKAWRKARKPVTKKVPSVAAVTFELAVDASRLATADDVRRDDIVLVDVRSPQAFAGETGGTARLGHIQGAVNFDYHNLLAANGTVKPAAEIRTLLADAGITPEDDIVLYCDTGTRAGLVYMILDDYLEFPRVRVYDGALYEWAADPDNPIVGK